MPLQVSQMHGLFCLKPFGCFCNFQQTQGGSGHSGRHCPTKTFPVCRDMDWGRLIHVPAMACDVLCSRCAGFESLGISLEWNFMHTNERLQVVVHIKMVLLVLPRLVLQPCVCVLKKSQKIRRVTIRRVTFYATYIVNRGHHLAACVTSMCQ